MIVAASIALFMNKESSFPIFKIVVIMNKKNILLSWIGDYDLRDTSKNFGELYGAITSILTCSNIQFQEIHLLSNRKNEQTKK